MTPITLLSKTLNLFTSNVVILECKALPFKFIIISTLHGSCIRLIQIITIHNIYLQKKLTTYVVSEVSNSTICPPSTIFSMTNIHRSFIIGFKKQTIFLSLCNTISNSIGFEWGAVASKMLSALLEGETLCERTYLKSPSLIKASFRDLDGL